MRQNTKLFQKAICFMCLHPAHYQTNQRIQKPRYVLTFSSTEGAAPQHLATDHQPQQ